MYNEFYRFTRKPFNITPNPDFLFLSDNHKEVFAHLLYGIQNHSGFIEVTGEVGTGKTTVLRTLLNQLDTEDYRLAFVFNPALSALELLQTINREYGVNSASSSRSELQAALNAFLLAENRAGRTVVLVIDEAQNLQAEVLEEIRLLSNLETETDKLVQIVLVGQPELAATLSRPDLRQLSQRITVRYHLKPMSAADTTEYINHRLRVAGPEVDHVELGIVGRRAPGHAAAVQHRFDAGPGLRFRLVRVGMSVPAPLHLARFGVVRLDVAGDVEIVAAPRRDLQEDAGVRAALVELAGRVEEARAVAEARRDALRVAHRVP